MSDPKNWDIHIEADWFRFWGMKFQLKRIYKITQKMKNFEILPKSDSYREKFVNVYDLEIRGRDSNDPTIEHIYHFEVRGSTNDVEDKDPNLLPIHCLNMVLNDMIVYIDLGDYRDIYDLSGIFWKPNPHIIRKAKQIWKYLKESYRKFGDLGFDETNLDILQYEVQQWIDRFEKTNEEPIDHEAYIEKVEREGEP
jgi:hypothetical protein